MIRESQGTWISHGFPCSFLPFQTHAKYFVSGLASSPELCIRAFANTIPFSRISHCLVRRSADHLLFVVQTNLETENSLNIATGEHFDAVEAIEILRRWIRMLFGYFNAFRTKSQTLKIQICPLSACQ